jgi:hypothetical protein
MKYRAAVVLSGTLAFRPGTKVKICAACMWPRTSDEALVGSERGHPVLLGVIGAIVVWVIVLVLTCYVIYDREFRTAHWKGEDISLRSEASFRVERKAMRNLVAEGVEWLEVKGRESRRRINIVTARRMAVVQGLHVLIPWRCWERIELERPSDVADGLEVVDGDKKPRARRAKADTGQIGLL